MIIIIMITVIETTIKIIVKLMISNSNWTEWSTNQGVIGRAISNRPSARPI